MVSMENLTNTRSTALNAKSPNTKPCALSSGRDLSAGSASPFDSARQFLCRIEQNASAADD